MFFNKPYLSSIFSLYLIIFIILNNCIIADSKNESIENKVPKVMITLLIRNKEYSLPYFFHYLENLDYDKKDIMLWLVL